MPNKSSWDRIESYLNSLKDTLVYDVGKLFYEIDQYIDYLKTYYHMSGEWGFSAHTTEEYEVVCLNITRTDIYGKVEAREYRLKIHICNKRPGEIYINKDTDTYYKCLEYDFKTRKYKWRQMTKVLWWYFKTWGKKAFWSDGSEMQKLDENN